MEREVLRTKTSYGFDYPTKRKRVDDEFKRPYSILFPGQVSIAEPLSKDLRVGKAELYKRVFTINNPDFADYSPDPADDYVVTVQRKPGLVGERLCRTPAELFKTKAESSDTSYGPFKAPVESYILSPEEKKRQWRSAYYYRTQIINNMEKNEVMGLKIQDCKCAEAAIDFYNKQHDTDYEIVATLGSYKCIETDFAWFHCNFRAKRKSDHTESYKLFFAELQNKERKLQVEHCQIIENAPPFDACTTDSSDAANHRSDIVQRCGMCHRYLWHPVGKFRDVRQKVPDGCKVVDDFLEPGLLEGMAAKGGHLMLM